MVETRIVRVDLADTALLAKLSRNPAVRADSSQDPWGDVPVLPPNVDSRLLRPAFVRRLREAGSAHGIRDLHLRIVSHDLSWPAPEGVQKRSVPMHLALAFRHGDARITGPVFVSVLHALGIVLPGQCFGEPWAVPLRETRFPLSAQQRQSLVEHYLGTYLRESASSTDLTVIAIPPKTGSDRDASPTHRAFSALIERCGGPQVVSLVSGDYYFFPLRAGSRGGCLASDSALLSRLTALRETWTENTAELRGVAPSPGSQAARQSEMRALIASLETIRASWRMQPNRPAAPADCPGSTEADL